MSDFNVYHQWLGISSEQQPPNHYQLLGIAAFEKDRRVIIAALDQRQLLLQKKLAGPRGELAGRLLEQIQQARLCLLNRLTKAHYDSTLRQQGVTASVDAKREPAVVATAALPESLPAKVADHPQLASNGFEFPDAADFQNDTNITQAASGTGKRTKSRAGQVSWVMNVIVLCCVGGGGWWLLDRGFLPQLKALWQPANELRVADDSTDADVEEERGSSSKPDARAKSQRLSEKREGEAPPEPRTAKKHGSAGASTSRNTTSQSPLNVALKTKRQSVAIDAARFANHQETVVDFALSANGQTLATAGTDGECRVWDLSKGETIARITGHSRHLHAVAISPDGAQVLTSGETLKLWNVATGAELAELMSYRRPSRAVQFLNGAQQVATVGAGTIEIWDLATQKTTHSMSGAHAFCGSLALTADNQTVAAATGAQTEEVTLFEPVSGKAIRSFVGHQARISSIVLSKDGTSLWAASGEHKARRWETKSETSQAIFAHADVIALSPDETMLVTGGLNGLVTIWNAQTGSGLLQLPRQKLRIMDITFLPDGEHILFAGESVDATNQTATIQLWQFPKLAPNSRGSRPNAIPVASSRP